MGKFIKITNYVTIGNMEVNMINFFIFIIVALVLSHYFEQYLRKKLGLETDPEIYQKPINRWHKGIEITLYVLFLFTMSYYNAVPVWIILTAFCVIYQGFHIFMKWKFARETKEHLLAIVFLFFYLTSIGAGMLLNVF